MKVIATSIIWVLSFIAVNADNEPCKESKIPADLHAKKMVFELPTYEEYVKNLLKASLNAGSFIDDNLIMNEKDYVSLRNEKIQTIINNFAGEYIILTEMDLKNQRMKYATEYGYALKERVVISKIEDAGTDFKEFTNFYLENIGNMGKYELLNPEDVKSADCLFKNQKWQYSDLVSIL